MKILKDMFEVLYELRILINQNANTHNMLNIRLCYIYERYYEKMIKQKVAVELKDAGLLNTAAFALESVRIMEERTK